MTSKRVQVEKAYDEPFVIIQNADILELMKRVKPASVCVYLAILTHANRKEGNSAYPSTSTIAKEANVSRRTVVSAVQELEAAGVMRVEHRTDPKKGSTSSKYWLLKIDTPCANSAHPPAQKLHTPSANSASAPMQNLHTNHMNDEPDEGEPKNTARKAPRRIAYTDEFNAFWAAYPKGHGVKKIAYDEWQRIAPDEEMVEEIRAGLEAWKACDRWQRGYIRDAERFLKHHMWESDPPADDVKPSNVTPFQNSQRKQDGWSTYDIADYARELERQGQ